MRSNVCNQVIHGARYKSRSGCRRAGSTWRHHSAVAICRALAVLLDWRWWPKRSTAPSNYNATYRPSDDPTPSPMWRHRTTVSTGYFRWTNPLPPGLGLRASGKRWRWTSRWYFCVTNRWTSFMWTGGAQICRLPAPTRHCSRLTSSTFCRRRRKRIIRPPAVKVCTAVVFAAPNWIVPASKWAMTSRSRVSGRR